MTDAALRRDADLALTVYLEPHADRRSVLIVGELEDAVDRQWAAVARSVFRLGRVDRELPRREAFDLIVINDLAALGRDPYRAVSELRGLLSRSGVLAAVGRAEGDVRGRRRMSAAEELEDLLGHDFREVRLFTQSLSGAVKTEELASEGAGLGIDSSLVRKVAPLRHVAVASDQPIDLERRLLVHVPAHAAGEREQPSQLVQRLEAAERDLDEVSAQVRSLEGALADERDELRREKTKRTELQGVADRLQSELSGVSRKLEQAEAEAREAGAEARAAQTEIGLCEERLVERAAELARVQAELERQQIIARDLLFELRRFEETASSAPSSDALSGLTRERELAMQRALEAEAARESLHMQLDELRAQIAAVEVERTRVELVPDPELMGTVLGLRRRVLELELELAASQLAPAQADSREIDAARGERLGLRFRLDEAERAVAVASAGAEARESAKVRELALELSAIRAEYDARIAELEGEHRPAMSVLEPVLSGAPQAESTDQLEQDLARERERARELEEELNALAARAKNLEQDLDEADRVADEQEEDLARLDALEEELKGQRSQLSEREDEVRAAQDELAALRSELDELKSASAARLEQSTRSEADLKSERDAARAALEEAKTILAQLQGGHVERMES